MPIEARFSSGLAASQSLSDILAHKKLEARQAMIDDINKKNIESEMSAREVNAKSQDEARQSMADQRRLTMLDSAAFDPDTDVTGILPQDVIDVGKKYGRIKPTLPALTPQVTTSDETGAPPSVSMSAPIPPKQGNFYRNPAQDKQARVKKNVGDLIAAMQHNPNMSPIESMMGVYNAYEQNPDASAVAAAIKPPPQDFVLDADTGAITQAMAGGKPLPANAHLTTRSRPPREPQGHARTIVEIAGKSYYSNPDDPTAPLIPVTLPPGAAPGPVQRPGTVPTGGGKRVVPADVNMMKAALTAYTKSKETNFSGTPTPEAQQMLGNAQNKFISYLPPDLQMPARKMLVLKDKDGNYYKDKHTTQELVSMFKGDRELSPEEISSLNEILPYLVGKF